MPFLHWQMCGQEIEERMLAFLEGETQELVATTLLAGQPVGLIPKPPPEPPPEKPRRPGRPAWPGPRREGR